MSEPVVLLEIADRIATVTLNDPDRRNPVTGNEMIAGLLDAFDQAQRDPGVSVMILTGADPAFCAGGDIKALHDNGIDPELRHKAYSFFREEYAMNDLLGKHRVPIVSVL